MKTCIAAVLRLLLLLVLARVAAGVPDSTLPQAAELVQRSGCAGGICVVTGADGVGLALALAKQGPFTVQYIATDDEGLARARKTISDAGMYGTVSAVRCGGERLPYVGNLVNLFVVSGGPSSPDGSAAAGKWQVASDEIRRVLAPYGIAVHLDARRATGDTFRKPWPGDIDEWTHYLHGADGNPVARDRVVGPPAHYQWLSGPTWQRSHESDSSLSTLVTARGRLFSIVDQAPASLVGDHPLPDKWFLVAKDAFNGVPLWKVPIRRWGWREWKPTFFNYRPGELPINIQKRLVAVADKVYVTLGYKAPVSELDARTGEILRTFEGTDPTGEILCLEGRLFLTVCADDRLKVMALDVKTGRPRWTTEDAYAGTTVDYIKWGNKYHTFKPPKLDASLNIATDGKSVALIDGADIVCLDAGDGRERWRAEFPRAEADETAGGIKANGGLWSGTMIVVDGVVLHASPSVLAAFAADTGGVLWKRPKRYIQHLWYEWKDVFVIDGLVWTWGEDVARITLKKGGGRNTAPQTLLGYDLKTGEVQRRIDLGSVFKTHHHHRCYRNKATLRYVIASRRGSEFVDLTGEEHTVDNWVRGTCHVGMMPANGLQYAPPHPCQCYIDEKLNGMNVLAAAGARDPGNRIATASETRLEKGTAFSPNPQSLPAPDQPVGQAGPIRNPQSSDWPAFRCDGARTGSVETDIPDFAASQWRVDLGSKLSPPIAVSNRVYVALVDEHQVVCVDAGTGRREWAFVAGARVDSPPTYYAGTLLFGCADGWVYCIRAGNGGLVWRFRAAPEERFICAHGQLESAWPVHGSVLVQNGLVYCAAGRSSQVDGGLWLYALDPATGEPRHEAQIAGPHYTGANIEENYGLPMGKLNDILTGDGSRVYLRGDAFDAQLEPQKGVPAIRTGGGFLDDSYFKRVPWRYGGDYGRLLTHDKRSVYFARMFDTLRGLDPSVYFTPGAKGYLLFARNAQGGKPTWSTRIPVRIRAMVLTPKRLYVAGPPDVVAPSDPLGAFEGRGGGRLYVYNSSSGERLGAIEIPSPPVFNGACAARGRLYVTDDEGGLACFGRR
jgi:outer membrane protein assembly factor BamB